MIWFLILVANSTCLKWQCHSLNDTVCVELYGHKIRANSKGCPIDYYCKLSDFQDWYVLGNPSSNDWFHCTRQNYNGPDQDDLADQQEHFCGQRDTDHQLKIGSHPKICDENSDCQTRGGWETECVCGLDGNYYCVAQTDSSAFDGYWDTCEAEFNNTGAYLISPESYAYWNYYQEYYVEIISA